MGKFPKSLSRQGVSERILKFRDEILNMTQIEFAKRAGVSLRALQTYEHQKADVSAEFLQRVYDVFGLDPLWLLTGKGEPYAETNRRDRRSLREIATDAVMMAVDRSGEQVTDAQRDWLIRATCDHLTESNGDMRLLDLPFLIRVRPA